MLSELVRQDRLVAISEIALEAPKTRLLLNQLGDWKLDNVLIVVEAIENEWPYLDVLPPGIEARVRAEMADVSLDA